MNSSTTVKSEWLETIAGKDVDMVLDMGNGITWTINGKSMTGKDFSNIDLGVITNSKKIPVDVINNVTGKKNVMQLTFKHEGSLGFTATLTIDLDKRNKGLIANLYYYNEVTKQLEFQSSSEIRDDGTTDLDFPHFSSYAVVIDKVSLAPEDIAAGAGVEADEALVGSDTDSRKNIIAVLLLIPAVFFVAKVKRRKMS